MADLTILAGGGPPLIASTAFDIGELGYVQAEYALAGTARTFGATSTGAVETADFVTRLLVYRPADPGRFNGTVWVEWLNVSGGLDAAPGWILAHTELIRQGAAWIGVSAQALGIEGGTSILEMTLPGLGGFDPERYGSLRHPGDRFSCDIYGQASALARDDSSTILEGLAIRCVMGMGESQSAARLVRYINDVDGVLIAHDGFFVERAPGRSRPARRRAGPVGSATRPSGSLRSRVAGPRAVRPV